MKVLFVSSINKADSINPIIRNQMNSLINKGADIDFYGIKGKGFVGYLRNIKSLKSKIRKGNYDLIHAHYSLSGIVAKFAGAKPLLVSLMGTDLHGPLIMRMTTKFFVIYLWDNCIVKTERMYEVLKSSKVRIIPNGVDFAKFKPVAMAEALLRTGWGKNEINILFPSDPNRKEKNFKLAKEAVKGLKNSSVKLFTLSGIDNSEVVYYLNSANVILLTSFWEGSPNVIKEAMACNIPIVSADVGDVREIIGSTEGCYVVPGREPDNFTEAILKAIKSGNRTNGRDNIKYLEADEIAERIIDYYCTILSSQKN